MSVGRVFFHLSVSASHQSVGHWGFTMKHTLIFMLILYFSPFMKSQGLKIFEFSSSLQENSKVVIGSDAPSPAHFSLCMDFYSRLDTVRRLLKSNGEDLEIQIDEGGYYIYVLVAGIWYLVIPESPAWVDTVTWESICVAFNSENQAVTVAFRGSIIFTDKQEYPDRKLSSDFLKDIVLGERNSDFKFIGDITRVNIWSKVLDDEELENITNCGSSSFKETPDILHWDDVEVTVQGDIVGKVVNKYPCTSASNNVHDVLMPAPAESMYHAVQTCKVLGGKLYFPSKAEELEPFMKEISLKLAQSSCKSFVWSNFVKNEYAGNNWTVYESSNTWRHPPFHYPGWMEFSVGQPNGREYEGCAGISLNPDKPNLIHDLQCSKKEYCYSCRYRQ